MSVLRRAEKEIKDEEEIEDILKGALVGRLGTCVGDEPYIVPLSFIYMDRKIYFHGAKQGRKMENILKNPRVCFEVDTSSPLPASDPCNYSFKYKSVIVEGLARIIYDSGEKIGALRSLVEKYAPGKGRILTEDSVRGSENLVVVEINIEQMVGKKSPV